MSKNSFKVGDKVRIVDNYPVSILSMHYFGGRVGTITDAPNHVNYAAVLIEMNSLRINKFIMKRHLEKISEGSKYRIL